MSIRRRLSLCQEIKEYGSLEFIKHELYFPSLVIHRCRHLRGRFLLIVQRGQQTIHRLAVKHIRQGIFDIPRISHHPPNQLCLLPAIKFLLHQFWCFTPKDATTHTTLCSGLMYQGVTQARIPEPLSSTCSYCGAPYLRLRPFHPVRQKKWCRQLIKVAAKLLCDSRRG